MVEQIFTDLVIDRAEFIIDRYISPDYYYWIIPKGDKAILGFKVEDKDKVLRNFYERSNFVIPERYKRERYPLTKIKTIQEIQLGNSSHFFIGEAAGLVMPRSGEGITSALESAESAAVSIITNCISKKATYAELIEKRIADIAWEIR
jgi:flavin-dependent dehydrogenase